MEKTKKLMTLTIIHDHPRVLLGMKKTGFGNGRWNGFGGKVEEGETIEEAARRELFEEAGIKANELKKIGILEFEFSISPLALNSAIAELRAKERKITQEILEVHIFKANNFRGEPKESEEMSPKWFFVDEIPFTEMWPDDRYWFPYFMRGRKFRGKFIFGQNDFVLDYWLKEEEDL